MSDSLLKLIDGGLAVDDRGTVCFVNDFDFKDVKRFYMVQNHKVGYRRGWHGHKKEAKYVFVPKGVTIIGSVRLDSTSPDWVVLSEKNPQVLYIPPGYANAFQTLTDDTQIMFFSTVTLEETKNDDFRYSLNKWPFFEGFER